MAGYVAGGIAHASLVSGYHLKKREQKKAKRERRALRKRISIQQGIGGSSFDKKEASVRRAAEKQLGGLSTAEKDISRVLREREAVSKGAVTQDLARSGLGSTSIGINAKRAVASDSSRDMSDLLAQLSQARAGIEANRENALGDLSLQRGNLQMGLAADQTTGLADLAYSGPGNAEIIAGAVAAGLGAYSGAGGSFGAGKQSSLLDQIYRGGFGQGRGYLQNRNYGQYNRGNPNYGLGGQMNFNSFGGYD